MQRAFADAEEQRGFRKRLEAMLREGEPEAALTLVRQGLQAIADNGLPIVDIALAADPHALTLKGWDAVAATIAGEEAGGNAITALSIDFRWPGHVGFEPDAAGHLAPYVETNYFADLTEIAFSTASRANILAGYSAYGSKWQGCFAEIDNAIAVEGLSALYGAVTAAAGTGDGDDVEGDAYLLAACNSAIVLHLAVRHAIAEGALPRPMAVLVGSNEDFPFFDAPVVSVEEARTLMPEHPAPPHAATPLSPAPNTTQDGVSGRALRSRLETTGGETDPPNDPPAAKGFFGRLFGR